MVAKWQFAATKADRKRRKLEYSGVRHKFARQKSRMKLQCVLDDFCSLPIKAVLERCVANGMFESIVHVCKHPAFLSCASRHGSLSLRKTLLVHWHFMHGKPIADIRSATGASEPSIYRIQRHVLGVIYFDAMDLQAQIRFGGDATSATMIEADEKCSISRSEMDPVTGDMVHSFLHYMAFLDREGRRNPDFHCIYQCWLMCAMRVLRVRDEVT